MYINKHPLKVQKMKERKNFRCVCVPLFYLQQFYLYKSFVCLCIWKGKKKPTECHEIVYLVFVFHFHSWLWMFACVSSIWLLFVSVPIGFWTRDIVILINRHTFVYSIIFMWRNHHAFSKNRKSISCQHITKSNVYSIEI